jgi:5-hmdU DNA kinase, helical domain
MATLTEIAAPTPAEEVAYWITERENIRRLKEAGKRPPWTRDTILNNYRFCNVHRENDAVTRWLAKNWRKQLSGHEHLVKALTLARLVNWPPTLFVIGLDAVRAWDEEKIIHAIKLQEETGCKVWSSAYIVSTNGKKIDKAKYVVHWIAGSVPLRSDIEANLLERAHRILMRVSGLGSFLAAQIVADLKNTQGDPLAHARDWWTWAAEGPGSIKGLRYYYGEAGMPGDFLTSLRRMIKEVSPLLTKNVGPLCAQDWQNVMCEYSKWKRTRNGEGRPKSYYTPNPDFP